MKIKDVLLKVGGAVLKNVPMGSMIYDIVDAVSGGLDPNITGTEMVAKINTLAPDIQERILSKQIDSSLKKYETWADLHKKMEDSSPMSKGRTVAIIIFAVMLCIIILTLCGIFAADYIMNGNLPSLDMVLGAMAIPGMCLLVSFGVRSDKILDMVISVAIKRMK